LGDNGDKRLGEADGDDVATPVSSCAREQAWECTTTAQEFSSPPHDSPGGLFDGGRATTKQIEGDVLG
jgi:hypothetical protein